MDILLQFTLIIVNWFDTVIYAKAQHVKGNLLMFELLLLPTNTVWINALLIYTMINVAHREVGDEHDRFVKRITGTMTLCWASLITYNKLSSLENDSETLMLLLILQRATMRFLMFCLVLNEGRINGVSDKGDSLCSNTTTVTLLIFYVMIQKKNMNKFKTTNRE